MVLKTMGCVLLFNFCVAKEVLGALYWKLALVRTDDERMLDLANCIFVLIKTSKMRDGCRCADGYEV